MPEGEAPQSASWGKTDEALARLAKSPLYEEAAADCPKGRFQGRPVIGRDTPINGGVYVGAVPREALVVDDSTQPELNQAYQELLRRRLIKVQRGEEFKVGILREVFDLARELLPRDPARVEELVRYQQQDQKVSLGSFIGKAGVCRHIALLTGYMLERLIRDGHISGKVSVDRNYIEGFGGHSWVRYINSSEKVFIIDAALGNGYCGPIEQATGWKYERPPTVH